jgi:triacylglycerol lipase
MTTHQDDHYKFFNFHPQVVEKYDIRNSVSMALACKLAYEKAETIETQVKQWGFDRFKFLEDKDSVKVDTQAFVMGNDEAVVLAFRGTENSTDWRTDLAFSKHKTMIGGLHRGFKAGLDAVIDDVVEAVSSMRDNNQAFWVTGHSLGGALATLATAYYRFEKQPVSGLYTFGSPRVGNKDFDSFFEPDFGRKSFRVVNGNDIVTRVPPRNFGFKHVGVCMFFDADDGWTVNPGAWNKFKEQVSITFENLGKFSSVNSHLLTGEGGYVARLLEEYKRLHPEVFA